MGEGTATGSRFVRRGGFTLEPIASNAVHVWCVRLGLPDSGAEVHRASLSAEERARADRFRFARDRARYTVAHSALRHILARHAGTPPDRLRFVANEYGKPSLASPSPIRFNLSHSHDLALVAVTSGREVGVDVERVRPEVECLEVARCYFSPREVAALAALPIALRVHGFFTCWTRKEAYIKATGRGLSQALDAFDVTVEPGSPAALLRCADDPSEVERWTMRGLSPAPGYVGALAVEGGDWNAIVREWDV
jgi:4'-phosphopantetheinyl transferase